jgi:tRNA A37 threonylcarbamoyladenosine dehydratase
MPASERNTAMPSTEATTGLSEREIERYRRQLMLQGFTRERQEMLRNCAALIAGVGGLGGTAALYLAVAGIGKMTLAHYGRLTQSNMNRQVLMRHDGIGKSRVEQAARTIREMSKPRYMTKDPITTISTGFSVGPTLRSRRGRTFTSGGS